MSAATAPIAEAIRPEEPSYAEYSRFEIELEFVQCLANPSYLHELATKNYFAEPEFLAYLAYLQYFKTPEYVKFLSYPGPTLRVLELLQHKPFRDQLADPNYAAYLSWEFITATTEKRPH